MERRVYVEDFHRLKSSFRRKFSQCVLIRKCKWTRCSRGRRRQEGFQRAHKRRELHALRFAPSHDHDGTRRLCHTLRLCKRCVWVRSVLKGIESGYYVKCIIRKRQLFEVRHTKLPGRCS